MVKRFKIHLAVVLCLMVLLIFFVSGQPKQSKATTSIPIETRCGWFFNPTPANAFFSDREAEWVIGVQGGYQAEGDWPNFDRGQWVKTNGNYGYGCSCMQVQVNRKTHEVIKIVNARVRPLSACRRDPALRKWKFK